jgi:hypothetical protein
VLEHLKLDEICNLCTLPAEEDYRNTRAGVLQSVAAIKQTEISARPEFLTVAFREIETTVLTQPSVVVRKIGLFCRSLIPFHGKRDVFPT